MWCQFIGGPLDGQTRQVDDTVQVYHYRPRQTVKQVPYYRSTVVPNAFFRDAQKASLCSPAQFHTYS